jgi:CHAT domain-containing protein
MPREAWDRLPQHLILVTHGILQALPLHALPLPEELGAGCLGDRFATSLTPSLSLAHRLARHAPTHCRGALAIVNPESWQEGFLAFGALEGIAFQEHHERARVCLGREATADGFFQSAASSPGLLHVSAHMGSDPEAPLKSGIRLHDERLSLREIYGKLKMDGTWLTILNGCQSGVIAEAAAGNIEGLPLAFLFGGSTNVISTLHTVYDVSSALLMDRFHQELRPGVSVSMALKHATDWLRGHRTEAVPDALVDGPAAARAIRAFTARSRAFRRKPKFSKSWREIFRHCRDRAAEVAADPHPPFATLQHWAAHIALGASWLPTPPARRPRTRPATASRTA